MQAWIAIGLSAAVYVITIAVVWGRMTERTDGLEDRVMKLEDHAQTPAEREALARVVHTELEAHSTEDTIKFNAIDQRMDALAGSLERKLDRILEAVTRNGSK